MTLRSAAAAAFGALLLVAPAAADEVRAPATTPSFVLELPAGWAQKPTEGDSALFVAGDASASIAVTVDAYAQPLDALAAETMKEVGADAPRKLGPARISGHDGFVYESTMTSASGVHARIHMIAVSLDSGHFASITLMTIADLDSGRLASDQAVLDGARLTGGK